MRRIRDDRENETLENARKAFDNYSDGKHNRRDIREYEKDIDANLRLVLDDIINETFEPEGYRDKVIFEKKERRLATAPVRDHVTEAAALFPYEQQVYDYISWHAPAVRPGLGNHAMFRFLRNDLIRCSQRELYYNLTMDIHHYFPMMDLAILKQKVNNKFKSGKLRRFVHKVIDSYPYGAPLGIKLSQLYGMICLADFDRLAERCFCIADDPERLAYWKQRYVTEKILTAYSPEDEKQLGLGSIWLAERFEQFAREGIKHYYRFVDNFVILHEDKAFLRIVRDIMIMILTRDYHCTMNPDHQVRPTWMGIRLCGYVFYHETVGVSKRNKQSLARKMKKLQNKGLDEEQIRIALSSLIGFVKHADSIHLLKTLGMEKSLGKIIKKRRVRPPFQGMSPDQKVPFSSVVAKCEQVLTGGAKPTLTKLFLEDYVIQDSKIEKETITVSMSDSEGRVQDIPKQVPGKVLALRFKKIIQTFTTTDFNGEEQETYQFEKERDEHGQPTSKDAEFYTFTGSKIMIDQAMRDFTREDLPVPTVIQQFKGRDGKDYTKFT